MRSKARSSAVLAGMAALLALEALAFGGVYAWGALILQLGSLVLLLVWALDQVRRGRIAIVASPLYWPALGFALLVAAQLVFGLSQYRYATWNSALNYAAYGTLMFLAAQTLADRSQRNRLLRALAWFGTAVAMFALVQKLAGNGKLYWFWPTEISIFFGPYINPNNYAGLMELLIPAALVLALRREQNTAARALYAVAAAVMAASIFVSGSRGGMLALTAELAAFLLYCASERRTRRTALAVVAVLVAAFALSEWLNGGEALRRIESIPALDASGSQYSRLLIARDTLHMFAARPLAGWGLGAFSNVFPEFRRFSGDLLINYAHNDYLQLLAEAGLLGAALAAWFLWGVFRGSRRALRYWRLPQSGSGLTLAALVGCSGVLVHSVSDFNLQIPANAALFYVLCAAACYRPAYAKGDEVVPVAFTSSRQPPVLLDAILSEEDADSAEDAADPSEDNGAGL